MTLSEEDLRQLLMGRLIRGDTLVQSLGKLCVGEKLFEQLDLEGFSAQKGHVDSDGVSRLSEALLTHPYIVNRIHALKRFAEEHPGLAEDYSLAGDSA